MRRVLGVVLAIILGLEAQAQITFEKGYFIDQQGIRTDCLIKNLDWKNNPQSFKYKLNETAAVQEATLEEVEEFGVSEYLLYKKFTVEVDRSSNNMKSLSRSKHPEFETETVFLRQLIKGKANLYVFEDGNLIRYFYSVDNAAVKQLVYKTYREDLHTAKTNNMYLQQLWAEVRTDEMQMSDLEGTAYKKNSLTRYFEKYNNSADPGFVNYDDRNKRDLFHLNIRPRYVFNSLSISNASNTSAVTNFDKKSNFSLGFEVEYILPYHKNKWSISLEPTYQQFVSEGSLGGIHTVKVDYKSIELPIGVRHYFFLNDKYRIFANARYVFDIPIKDEMNFERSQDLRVNTNNNFNFGLGIKYDNKYSLELSHGFSRELLADYPRWNTDFTSFSVILGYSIY